MKLQYRENIYEAKYIEKDKHGYKGFDENGDIVFIVRTDEECIVTDENNVTIELVDEDSKKQLKLEQELATTNAILLELMETLLV
ncbi:hypothetical protein ETC05_16520 [Geobacillus sp. BMUD]|uniref:hypothetical protein n=1 Tax=Geobacillus sp. BMUD TaxID=2508876 RepID=UPI0014920C29|nr:hypothetical protein [Geobacillus sp. BMUD]NNU85343.1 hypothetical protein [Geobacillus sp. BMUD]